MSTEITKASFDKIQDAFIEQSGLPKEVFAKEVSFALQHLAKNPYLNKCTPHSLYQSVLNIAQVGLSLNPVSKLAYLVPRYSKTNGMECCLEPSYVGMAKLLTDTGSVKAIECHIINEGDKIEYDMASTQKMISHVPYVLNGKPKGKIMGVYSVAFLNDGSRHTEFMGTDEIHDIRDRSESYKAFKSGKVKQCTWDSDEGEMCRKTVIKRHYKHLPKSERMDKIDHAIAKDNYVNGFRNPVTHSSVEYMNSLFEQTRMEEEPYKDMKLRIDSVRYQDEAGPILDELNAEADKSQINMDATSVSNKIKEIGGE